MKNRLFSGWSQKTLPVLPILLILCMILAGCGQGTQGKSSNAPTLPSESTPSSEASASPYEPSETPSLPTVAPSETTLVPSGTTVTDPLVFTCGKITGAPGKTVTVPVLLSNNPGIAGYSITMEYDDRKLEFQSAVSKAPGTVGTTNSTVSGKVRLMWTLGGGNHITVNDAACCEVTFRIKDNAPLGESPLTLCLDGNMDSVFRVSESFAIYNVPVAFRAGSVTINTAA